MAIQIAKAFGAYVAATASARNQDLLRDLGADLAIDYSREQIDAIRSKFDVVLDGVGNSVWPSSLRALRFGGRLVALTMDIPHEPSSKLKFFSTVDSWVGSGQCPRCATWQANGDGAGKASWRRSGKDRCFD